jgi:hypothetical protein
MANLKKYRLIRPIGTVFYRGQKITDENITDEQADLLYQRSDRWKNSIELIQPKKKPSTPPTDEEPAIE